MYEQSLYRVIEPIKINTIKRLNKAKKWKVGKAVLELFLFKNKNPSL